MVSHTKSKGRLIVLAKQEGKEINIWCKGKAEMIHGLDLIQVKTNVDQIC